MGLIINIIVILSVGLLVEKWMEHKGKKGTIKNINYYLDKGNNFPLSVLKAIGSGYVWLWKFQIKAIFVVILAMFNVKFPSPTEIDEEEAAEEERVRQEQYERSRRL